MKRLSKVLLSWGSESRRGYDSLTLAELCREQSRFDEAELIILAIDKEEEGVTSNLIAKLLNEKQPAPMRYRM